MKNRSTIQTLTFVQTNPDHLYMKLNMPGTCNHPQFRFEKIAPCNNFSWLLYWHLKMAPGDFTGSYFFGARAAPGFVFGLKTGSHLTNFLFVCLL